MDVWIGNKRLMVFEKNGKYIAVCPECKKALESTRYEDVRTGYFLCNHLCYMEGLKHEKQNVSAVAED